MRKILAMLAFAAIAAAGAVWVVLGSHTPAALAALSDPAATAVYSAACFAAVGALLVALVDDRCPLQFFCAAATVAALLGLAAFHSTHTRRRGRGPEENPRPIAHDIDRGLRKGGAGMPTPRPVRLLPTAGSR